MRDTYQLTTPTGLQRIAAAVSVIALAVIAALGSAPAAHATSGALFNDVPPSAKFYIEVTWLANNNVTTGYSDGGFHPKESVSREAFAAFLYRLAGKPSVALPSRSPFKDVKKSDQFYKEIVWLSKKGISTGYANGTFKPGDKISREAIAAFLYRFEGKPSFTVPSKSPFKDMRTSSKFFKEVTWLSKSGVTTGYSDGTFRPKINVSREAIAAFLYRGHKDGINSGATTPASPGDSKNCTDFANWPAAQKWHDTYYSAYGDIANLDGDGDGFACTSLPGSPPGK